MQGGGYSKQAVKLERKIIEKKRRMHMKSLLLQLSSIIPQSQPSGSKNALKQKEILEEATSYVGKLRERLKTLENEKTEMKMKMSMQRNHMTNIIDRKVAVQVQWFDDCMRIVLMSTLNKSFKLHEVIRILGEEGAQVIHANFSRSGDKIVFVIHSQAISSRIGLEEKRIKERLEELV
ncbi:Achaete-scute transcription factor-related protein [Dioscorea alata]|uniref:Achaete-scute transcription factor-related protein n=1 Tax=Dioscorea alata TaxID=55571 RepID=A0ACB7U6K1_DIOAL|nr:Achaete-scute transcription factor-related protein [Dioscorea alata]